MGSEMCIRDSYIPAPFDNLGLAQEELKSHAAWDPGALAVASCLAKKLDAPLIASGVSRLVYDCNRPPTAQDAMPTRSEVIDVPGNRDLSQADRDARTKAYYRPFQTALKQAVKAVVDPVIVTVHSFTPCLLYTSPSPRDLSTSRMPSSA